jgi:hypothetical protein
MTPNCQFWWNWSVTALAALGTIGAVVVALFGDLIRGWSFLAPQLSIRLKDPKGEFSVREITGGGAIIAQRTGSRWYHIEVKNRRRWSPARSVQLSLIRFEELNADDKYETRWTGEMPFQWKDGQLRSLTPDLGREVDSDRCSVTNAPNGPYLQLHPIIPKFSVPTEWHSSRVRCAMTFQAHSLVIDSNLLRIEIAWDGQWADGTDEMARHLVITVSPAVA